MSDEKPRTMDYAIVCVVSVFLAFVISIPSMW